MQNIEIKARVADLAAPADVADAGASDTERLLVRARMLLERYGIVSRDLKTPYDVREVIARVRPTFPAGTEISIVADQSVQIRQMVRELENNILSGLILVVVVLLAFFGVRNDRGLTTVLADSNVPLGWVTVATSHPRLGLMPSGPLPSESTDPLGSPQLAAGGRTAAGGSARGGCAGRRNIPAARRIPAGLG